ncbi:MAG TPA: HlyD family efflux transporter periplasmic adaptor subunit [Kofleriaceae bacterium]|nr:HlyD family efflux transporter periplasmic adaptor subunit [Kofleriaceae bacterium]
MTRIGWALLLVAAACARDAPTTWVTVEKGDLVLGVEVTGAMKAVDSTPIKPPPIGDHWEFKIAEMAPEGAEVKKGDPIVTFDASEMMRELQEMQNEAEAAARALEKQRGDGQMSNKDQGLAIAEAKAALDKAALKADQPGDLTAMLDIKLAQLDHQLAVVDHDRARAAFEQGRRHDQAALARLSENLAYYQGRVREVQENIGRMRVPSPRDGTVIYPISWRGEKKKVGDSAWRMETVLEVASLDHMVGDGEIDEVDSSKVVGGQPVLLRVDAHAETPLAGRVKSIANIVQRQSQANPSRIVKLTIELEKKGGLPLRPGMRFRGRVETGRVPAAVLVPAEAVFITADGPVAFRRTSGGGAEKVRLRLGPRSDISIQVLSGLSPGDQVSRVNLEEVP